MQLITCPGCAIPFHPDLLHTVYCDICAEKRFALMVQAQAEKFTVLPEAQRLFLNEHRKAAQALWRYSLADNIS